MEFLEKEASCSRRAQHIFARPKFVVSVLLLQLYFQANMLELDSPKQSFFRRVWPTKSKTDQIAFSVTHIGLVSIISFQWFVVLPIYHAPFTFWYMAHVAAGLFIAFSVFSNLYSMIFTDSTIKCPTISLPSVLRNGWYYCHDCQMNAPPRSHHCPICEICVLKRDHHCIFTGNCVGHKNHRYFICMAFYLWLGSVYTLLFNLDYFASVLGGFSFWLVVKLIFPAAAFVLGYCTFYQLRILIVCGICIFTAFMFTCLMSFQIFFISRGQTQFECKKKIFDYRRSFRENWLDVLGSRWYLTFFGYFFKSPLPREGTDFTASTINITSENSKDI
eukprot:gene15850-17448_t